MAAFVHVLGYKRIKRVYIVSCEDLSLQIHVCRCYAYLRTVCTYIYRYMYRYAYAHIYGSIFMLLLFRSLARVLHCGLGWHGATPALRRPELHRCSEQRAAVEGSGFQGGDNGPLSVCLLISERYSSTNMHVHLHIHVQQHM